jgi:uncharacterized membrane protein
MFDKIENGSIFLGTFIGLSQIETILGIIILCFQILIILIKFGKKLYSKIKSKNYSDIEKDVEDTLNDLNDLKDKINGKSE